MRRTITVPWLRKLDASESLTREVAGYDKTDAKKVIENLIKNNHLQWASWLITKCMIKNQFISYAVFAAEQVLGYYEEKYPDDNRPRLAIAAARRCIENSTIEARKAAWSAYSAIYETGSPALRDSGSVASAADSAANAALCAAESGGCNTSAAASANYAVTTAAAAIAAANLAYGDCIAAEAADTMRAKILRYGLELLEGGVVARG